MRPESLKSRGRVDPLKRWLDRRRGGLTWVDSPPAPVVFLQVSPVAPPARRTPKDRHTYVEEFEQPPCLDLLHTLPLEGSHE